MMSIICKTGSLGLVSRFTPLCLCLLATALLLQDAHALRTATVVDDEVTTSLICWIHPAAIIAMALGYALSVFVIFSGRSTQEKEWHRQKCDTVEETVEEIRIIKETQ